MPHTDLFLLWDRILVNFHLSFFPVHHCRTIIIKTFIPFFFYTICTLGLFCQIFFFFNDKWVRISLACVCTWLIGGKVGVSVPLEWGLLQAYVVRGHFRVCYIYSLHGFLLGTWCRDHAGACTAQGLCQHQS